jgi:hypothetical protein
MAYNFLALQVQRPCDGSSSEKDHQIINRWLSVSLSADRSWRLRSERLIERVGWPLLTVETETNGDSKSTYERGPSLVGSLGSLCRYKRFMSCLGCSGQPSTKCFSSPYISTLHLSPSRSKLGRRSCQVACLLICVSG